MAISAALKERMMCTHCDAFPEKFPWSIPRGAINCIEMFGLKGDLVIHKSLIPLGKIKQNLDRKSLIKI